VTMGRTKTNKNASHSSSLSASRPSPTSSVHISAFPLQISASAALSRSRVPPSAGRTWGTALDALAKSPTALVSLVPVRPTLNRSSSTVTACSRSESRVGD